MPVSTDWVAAVSPQLRGGLYIEAVLPGSPAAQAAIQKGDILVGMNVGTRHWETIRPDNILYVLRQPEAVQTQGAVLYVVRRNGSSRAGSAWRRAGPRRPASESPGDPPRQSGPPGRTHAARHVGRPAAGMPRRRGQWAGSRDRGSTTALEPLA